MEIYKEWQEAAEEFSRKGKIALITGNIDTGKTTFIKWFTHYLLDKNLTVAIVDGDVGQSSIGPPSTIGLAMVRQKFETLHELSLDAFYFTGSITPSKNLIPCITGVKKMVDRALELSADRVIIDTTGMVRYPEGVILKQAKIELVKPDFILAFSQGNELEQILSPFRYLSTHSIKRLPPGETINRKTQEYRANERKKRFLKYFDKIKKKKFDLNYTGFSGIHFAFNHKLSLQKNELRWLSSTVDFPVEYGEKGPDFLIITFPELIELKNVQELKNRYSVSNIVRVEPVGYLAGLTDVYDETICIGIITDFRPKSNMVEMAIPSGYENKEVKRIHSGKYRLPDEIFEEILNR